MTDSAELKTVRAFAEQAAAQLTRAEADRRAAAERLLASGGLASAFDRLTAFRGSVGDAVNRIATKATAGRGR